jgi:hypothetical protein
VYCPGVSNTVTTPAFIRARRDGIRCRSGEREPQIPHRIVRGVLVGERHIYTNGDSVADDHARIRADLRGGRRADTPSPQ